MAEALAALPDEARAVVFSDNQSLVESLATRLETWRANGFAKVDPLLVESVRNIDMAIRTKKLVVRWQWVRHTTGNTGNERADALAAQGRERPRRDRRDEEARSSVVAAAAGAREPRTASRACGYSGPWRSPVSKASKTNVKSKKKNNPLAAQRAGS